MYLLILRVCVILGLFSTHSYAASDNYSSLITLNNTSFKYSLVDKNPHISSTGFLHNNSDITLKNIVHEVQYYNDTKQLIDSTTQKQYSMIIPPQGHVSFSIKDFPNGAAEDYASHTIKVLSADAKHKCNKTSKKTRTLVKNLIYSWAPMLLLIAVWLLVIRQQNKNSPYVKSVELIAENNKLLLRQNEIIEKLTQTLANKKDAS